MSRSLHRLIPLLGIFAARRTQTGFFVGNCWVSRTIGIVIGKRHNLYVYMLRVTDLNLYAVTIAAILETRGQITPKSP